MILKDQPRLKVIYLIDGNFSKKTKGTNLSRNTHKAAIESIIQFDRVCWGQFALCKDKINIDYLLKQNVKQIIESHSKTIDELYSN